jgi:hypothetical protein
MSQLGDLVNQENFDNAKFYDCRDPDTLNYQDVEEALEDALETAWEKGKTPDEILSEIAPIEVIAYNPMKKSPCSISGRAESTLEDLEEHLMEDYGNFDGDHDFWSKEEREELLGKFHAVFEEALAKISVWQCEKVAAKEFTAAEVKQIVPGWFEEAATA